MSKACDEVLVQHEMIQGFCGMPAGKWNEKSRIVHGYVKYIHDRVLAFFCII